MATGRIDACTHCGEVKPLAGRGLCSTDFSRFHHAGTLDDWPRVNRTLEDFAADFAILRARGLRNREVAIQLGYRVSSISKIITRARAAKLIS